MAKRTGNRLAFRETVKFMLPFDNRPWARSLAGIVIGISLFVAAFAAWYLYSIEELHIPEVTGIVLLLLTIIPPNVAIALRKHDPGSAPMNHASLNPR